MPRHPSPPPKTQEFLLYARDTSGGLESYRVVNVHSMEEAIEELRFYERQLKTILCLISHRPSPGDQDE